MQLFPLQQKSDAVVLVCPCNTLQVIETDARIADIHANSESFDPKSELSFKYLQVDLCSCM